MATHFSNYKFDSPAIYGKTTLKLFSLITFYTCASTGVQIRPIQEPFQAFIATICNKQGKWDPDPAQFCAIALGNQSIKLLNLYSAPKLTLSYMHTNCEM